MSELSSSKLQKDSSARIKLTYTFGQRLVPLSRRLTGEHGRSEQVVPGVTVVKHHRAEGEVAVLDFALPDGVGWDPWIGAVDHCTNTRTHRRGDRQTDRHTDGRHVKEEMCYLA